MMGSGLGVICMSYIRNIVWEGGTTSIGPGLTCKNNIMYNTGYSQEIY